MNRVQKYNKLMIMGLFLFCGSILSSRSGFTFELKSTSGSENSILQNKRAGQSGDDVSDDKINKFKELTRLKIKALNNELSIALILKTMESFAKNS